MEPLVRTLVSALYAYAAVGFVFGVFFAFLGVGRIDPVARSGTWGFRLLILPGAAALWPFLFLRCLRGTPEGREENT